MIDVVDMTLAKLLAAGLDKEGFPGIKVVHGGADKVAGKADTVVLQLMRVQENVSARSYGRDIVRPEKNGDAQIRRSAVTLELTYCVSAHNDDVLRRHALMGSLLTVMFRIASAPEGLLNEDLSKAGGSMTLSVAQPMEAIQEWETGAGISLTVNLTYNPYESKNVRLVKEVLVGVGQGTDLRSPNRSISLTEARVGAAGIVTHSVSGRPLAGAIARVVATGESAAADERGVFYFLNLPTGKAEICVSHDRFHSKTVEAKVPPPGRADLLEPLEVPLEPVDKLDRSNPLDDAGRVIRIEISGRLRANHQPAAFVPVRAVVVVDKGKPTERTSYVESVSDPDGFYVLGGLPPGEHPVEALLPGQTWTVVPKGS